VVKCHRRQESLAAWLEQAVAVGERPLPREGQAVWSGATGLARGDEQRRVVFQVIRRTPTAADQRLRLPALPVPTRGSRWRAPPAAVIARYHRHGTSEPFHSELKTDRDLERWPAGQFAVNVLVLRLGMVANDALRLGGQTALRSGPGQPSPPLPLARPRRRVILDLRYQAARRVRHARRGTLAGGRDPPWFGPWQRGDLRCGHAGAAGQRLHVLQDPAPPQAAAGGVGPGPRRTPPGSGSPAPWATPHRRGRSAPTHAGAARGQLRPGHPAFPVPAFTDVGHGQLRPTGPG